MNENPYMAKLREMMLGVSAPLTSDFEAIKRADGVDTSSDTAKGYAEGGEVPPQPTPDDLDGVREMLKKASAENKPAPSGDLKVGLTQPDLDADKKTTKGIFMTQRFAGGGVAVPNAHEPEAPKGPSETEKRELVLKALHDGALNFADGGTPDQTLPADAPQDNKLQAILKALGMAGSDAMSSVLPGTQALADKVAPAAASVASTPGVAPAINSALGTNLPEPAPIAPPAAPIPNPPHIPNPPPLMPAAKAPAAEKVAPTPDPLAGLGTFDPNTVAPGFNPADRQALAGSLDQKQHTFGNYLAEAIAGLGDAVAAKGGVKQNSLGDIFGFQTQQRHEALENFDKARQAAVEHFTMKNQADQNLINNLKARNEMFVSPGIAQALGHPELANKPVAHAELVLKTDAMKYDYANKMTERKQSSLKNAAEEVDKALTHGGIAGTQKALDPQSRLEMIHRQATINDPEAFGWHGSEVK